MTSTNFVNLCLVEILYITYDAISIVVFTPEWLQLQYDWLSFHTKVTIP